MVGTDPKLRNFFSKAVQCQAPEERAAYLEQVCQGDAELRARLEELLQAHREAGSFLQEPSAAPAQTVAGARSSERPGTVIGPYKLLQQIGEGGMGTVWMAEQTQPVQRRVALKVIKPGMDSRQVIARFEAERQALAMMDHVNIARVLDAGTADSGLPYFVMELIHGVPITQYCDDNHLTPRERLELFVPVCQAIQHAHQKGVIHRDIKPSNVMITLYDGKPVPKVIDFGVAKATEQTLTQRTLFTQYGTMVGTLEYMSPEQAEMSALGVDSRSDIYSLGVLLYELLTGSTPLSCKRVREVAYAEILRMIKEEEPPKPSTRLSDSGEALASISAQRKTEPAKLARLVRGELDWIVMKSLEKDRNRRYETPSGLAQDVRRYLSDETVQACPPSTGYRLRKFARRHKVALTIGALIALMPILGAGALTMGYFRIQEEQQRTEAEKEQTKAESERAQENLRLALHALDEVYLREPETRFDYEPRLSRLDREFLLKGLAFYQRFADRNCTNSAARLQAGTAFRRVGLIHWRLGENREAEAADRKSIALLNKVAEEFPAEPQWRFELASASNNLGVALDGTGRPQEAEQVYRRALALLEQFRPKHSVALRPREVALIAQINGNLGKLLEDQGRRPAAEVAYRQNLALCQQIVAVSPNLENRMGLGVSQLNLGSFLANISRLQEAANPHREAVALFEKLAADFPDEPEFRSCLAKSHSDLGNLLRQTGQLSEAERNLGLGLTLSKEIAANFPNVPDYRSRLAMSLGFMGGLQEATKHPEQAEHTYREALAISEKLATDFPKVPQYLEPVSTLQLTLGQLLRNAGRSGDAETADRQCLEVLKRLTAAFPTVVKYHGQLANLLMETGRVREAESEYREAIRLAPACADLHNDLGALLCDRKGDYNGAVASFQEAIRLKPDDASIHRNLALALSKQGKDLEAVAAFREFVRLKPNDSSANNELARELATSIDPRIRDAKRAVELAKKAVELAPKESLCWNTLGVAHYRAGDWKTGVEALQTSMELRRGGDARDWFFLAMAYWQLHQKDEATKWRDRAIVWMDKNQEAIKKNASEWEELNRFRAEAAELLDSKMN